MSQSDELNKGRDDRRFKRLRDSSKKQEGRKDKDKRKPRMDPYKRKRVRWDVEDDSR